MSDNQRLHELAESVADGHITNWEAFEGAPDAHDRETIAGLRAVATIGKFFAGLSGCTGTEQPALPPGAMWGTLRVIEHVGSGRFGDVYRAWDPALDREVALKILRETPHSAADTTIVDEGRLMARVRHSNVVTIHGAQRLDGATGLWMEYIDGRTLAAELADRGPFDAAELARTGVELCRALAAVHGAALVHRDVKAQNVLRDGDGRIVLGDFGTGRELVEPADLSGTLAGTPTHLAPELFAGAPASAQSDIYSLGVLLFQLATQVYPVPGRTLGALREAHTAGTHTPLRSLRPDLPKRLTAIIDKALASSPDRRFQNAEEMAHALEAVAARQRQTPRFRAAAVTTAVAVACAIGVFALSPGPAARPERFVERHWVLLAALENHTGNPSLDGALEYALERELSTSPFVNVVSRQRIEDSLRLMRKPLNTRVDVQLGREVALRDGDIRAVISGTVEKIGGAYVLRARIINPADGAVVASVDEASGSPGDLLGAVARISSAMRRSLGEALPRAQPPMPSLQKVTTGSMRALQLYSQARAMTGEGYLFSDSRTPPVVEQLLTDALNEDPQFTWAHILLAHAIRVQGGRSGEVLSHLERAATSATRGVDRYVAEAELAAFRGVSAASSSEKSTFLEHALATFEAALQLQPDHFWALSCALNVTGMLGRVPSPELLRRYADLRPNSLDVLVVAARVAARAGRWAEAREYAARGRALDLPLDERTKGHKSWLLLFPIRDAWQKKDARAALAGIDAVLADPRVRSGELGVGYPLFYFSLALGRSDYVERVAALMPEQVTSLRFRLVAAAERGDTASVRRISDELWARYGEIVGGSGLLAVEVVTALLDAGMFDEVERVMTSIRTRPREGHGSHLLQFVEGLLAVSDGRTDYGLRLIEPIAVNTDLSLMTNMRASLKVASVRAARGGVSEAISVLENVSHRAMNSEFCISPVFLHVRAKLAEMYRKAGRSGEADQIESELRMLLAQAEDSFTLKRSLAATSGLAN